MSSSILRVASGVSSEGFRRTEFPAANAGATFQAARRSGKFQGTIQATTPIGSLTTSASCWFDGGGEISDGVAGDLPVVVETGRSPPDLVVVLYKGFTAFAGHDLRQLVGVVPQVAGQIVEQFSPVETSETPPLRKPRPGAVYGRIDLLPRRDRYLLDCLLRSRIDNLHRPVQYGPLSGASRSAPTHALEVDCHVFGLQVLFDAFRAAFAAEAGVLDTAEGGGGVGDHALVEAYHAGLETLADAQGPLKVAGVDVGHEAVFCVVGGCYGLLFRIEGGDRGHGAEDFLLEERRVVGDVVEDGGAVEVARTFHLLGPDYGAGPLAQGVFHEISDLIALVA